MGLNRCTNCGMYGTKKQIKYKIAQSPLTENIYAFLLCIHCNEKDGLLCVQYGGKTKIESNEDIEKLDHWKVKIKPMEVKND